jgi:hypothetical protein
LFIAKFDSSGHCIGILNSDTRTTGALLTVSCGNQSIFVGSNYNGSAGNLAQFGVMNSQNQNIFIGAIDNSILCNLVSTHNETARESITFHAYPNPCSDYLILDFSKLDLPCNSLKKIELANMLGEIIHIEITNEDLALLRTNQLSGGLYFVLVSNEKGEAIGEIAKIIHVE